MSRRSAVDVSGGAQPSTEEFSIARQVVKKSRLVAALEAHVGSKVGRPRHLSLEGLLVAMQVNALRRHHRAHVVQAARMRIPSHSVHPFRSNPYTDSDVFVHPVRSSPLALA